MLIGTELRQVYGEQETTRPYLAALTSDTAVVITSGLVPAHHTLLVFVQVTRDIPWEGKRAESVGTGHSPVEAPTLYPPCSAFLLQLSTTEEGVPYLKVERKNHGGGDCPSFSLQIYIMEVVLLTVDSGTQPTSMYLFLSLALTMFPRQALNPCLSHPPSHPVSQTALTADRCCCTWPK